MPRCPEVDAVGELRVLFDAGARAAPEAVVLGVVDLPAAGVERKEVHGSAGRRLDGPQAVVEECALVVVEVARVRGPLVEAAA